MYLLRPLRWRLSSEREQVALFVIGFSTRVSSVNIFLSYEDMKIIFSKHFNPTFGVLFMDEKSERQ